MTDLRLELEALARAYPAALVEHELQDVPRIAHHARLVLERCGTGARVCDVGGGIGMLAPALAGLGAHVTLVDDFADPVNAAVGGSVLDLHRARGVVVIRRDVVEEGLELEPQSLDCVTSFDSLEHWHHSPRPLLQSLVAALRPSGWLILGAPNRVNARKRLTTPFGRNEWSPFAEWYEPARFRGHVREPTTGELRHIATDLGLEAVTVWGRNWLGLTAGSAAVRAISRLADRPLRLAPSLCSDIYVAGRKPPMADTSSRARAR